MTVKDVLEFEQDLADALDYNAYHNRDFGNDFICVDIDYKKTVKKLLQRGYGDIDKAIKEFAQKLKNRSTYGFVDCTRIDELLKEFCK